MKVHPSLPMPCLQFPLSGSRWIGYKIHLMKRNRDPAVCRHDTPGLKSNLGQDEVSRERNYIMDDNTRPRMPSGHREYDEGQPQGACSYLQPSRAIMFKSVFVSAKFLKCRGHASGLEEFVRTISDSSASAVHLQGFVLCYLFLMSRLSSSRDEQDKPRSNGPEDVILTDDHLDHRSTFI